MVDPLILDHLDRQLVHALQVDGRATFSRIADALGALDRTIARRYRRLRSAGALRVVGLANRRSGEVEWFVRIRCSPDAAMALATTLSRRDDTSWVSITSGGTEVTCVTQTPDRHGQGSLLLQKLSSTPRIASVTAHCLLRAVAGTAGWPVRTTALTSNQIAGLRPPTSPEPNGHKPVNLTDADERLLAALAKDGRATHPSLAAATGWSESTVRRRLDDLRRIGVLYFDVEIDPRLFGYTTEAILWLTVAPTELTTVATTLATHTEIAFAAAITGPANVVAFTVCRDTDALYQYLATRLGALSGVLQVETTTINRHAKRAGAVLMPTTR